MQTLGQQRSKFFEQSLQHCFTIISRLKQDGILCCKMFSLPLANKEKSNVFPLDANCGKERPLLLFLCTAVVSNSSSSSNGRRRQQQKSIGRKDGHLEERPKEATLAATFEMKLDLNTYGHGYQDRMQVFFTRIRHEGVRHSK